jgi:hypothetical protein
MKPNHSTGVNGATVNASSAMLTDIRILPAASLMHRARFFASVLLVEGPYILLKLTAR